MTGKVWIADGILLLTAMIWGVAFVVVKDTLSSFPPGFLVAIRYTISAAITAGVFRRHLKGLTWRTCVYGAVTGLLLALAYIVQTVGLQYTTAGKNAFLTTIYVLLVPVGGLLFGNRLTRRSVFAALFMLMGIAFLSLKGEDGSGLNYGDGLTLLCGVFYAAHILAIEQFQKKMDAYALIVLQFAFCALFAYAYSALFEQGRGVQISRGSVMGILYLAVFSTAIGMSLQNIGQSMAPSSHASILLSMESVFGALSGCILLREALTPTMALGFASIFVALIINSLGQKHREEPQSGGVS